jgi:hypothetical protein
MSIKASRCFDCVNVLALAHAVRNPGYLLRKGSTVFANIW